MPRLARLDAPGVLHRVMGGGIERKKNFRNDRDRKDFLERLEQAAFEGAMEIYARVLMPNHFHILCKTKNIPLSASMRKILTGCVVNFNGRRRRRGRLFRNRFKSVVCREDLYFKEWVRYIHLNSTRGCSVEDLGRLNKYPWSGHSALVGKIGRKWRETRCASSFFGSSENSKANCLSCVEKGLGQGRRPELTGGGLIGSLGGWSEMSACRRRNERQVSDQRILGDGDFAEQVVSGLEDRINRNPRLSWRGIDMDAAADKIAGKYDISKSEPGSGSRRRPVASARRALSWICVRELGCSCADAARYLGVSNSCATRILPKGKTGDMKCIELERNGSD